MHFIWKQYFYWKLVTTGTLVAGVISYVTRAEFVSARSRRNVNLVILSDFLYNRRLAIEAEKLNEWWTRCALNSNRSAEQSKA